MAPKWFSMRRMEIWESSAYAHPDFLPQFQEKTT